jgi:hypothetical protein
VTRNILTRVAAAAAVAAGLLLGAGAPAAASPAASAAIDPACAEFALPGYVDVQDPADLPPTLPSHVTRDDMSCVLVFLTAGAEGVTIYAYLDDPFPTFLAKTDSFLAAGWSVTESNEDGEQVPVDVAALPTRQGDGEINLVFVRGNSAAGLYYASDSADATWGLGTFLAVFEGGPAGGTDIDDPSAISDLRTIFDAVPTPAQGGVLLVSAALLTLLLAIPAFLLSKVLSDRYDQLFGWLGKGRLGRLRDELTRPTGSRRRWLLLGIGMALAALIACFIDPRFGVNPLSVRLYLTLLFTFALFNVGAWAVVSSVMKRVQPEAKPVLTFHPASLLVVAAAVLLSRLLQFDPGIVFGLVAGTTFAVTLALSREAVVIIAGTAYAGAVALLAWIGYSVLTWLNPLDGFAVALTELLGGITLEGVSTLPIALIPLATLDGGILFRWRRWVWAVVYAAGMALFLLVLFNLPGGDTPVDQGFWNWLLVFAAFAVLAVAVWLVDLLVRRRESATPAA